jgi:carbon monoxide dehydrogenase subunit G
MGIVIPLDIRRELSVKAPLAQVFELLADVPASASHFPKVRRLVDLGDGVYRWEMERVGLGRVQLQTVYASRYRRDKRRGTVSWEPVPGVGNAQIGGSWQLARGRQGTRLTLLTQGVVDVPLPALMKPVVAPLVRREFENLVASYVDSLTRHLGGPA